MYSVAIWECRKRAAQLALAIAVLLTAVSPAFSQLYSFTKATTSRAAREDAIRGIPFRSLSQGSSTPHLRCRSQTYYVSANARDDDSM